MRNVCESIVSPILYKRLDLDDRSLILDSELLQNHSVQFGFCGLSVDSTSFHLRIEVIQHAVSCGVGCRPYLCERGIVAQIRSPSVQSLSRCIRKSLLVAVAVHNLLGICGCLGVHDRIAEAEEIVVGCAQQNSLVLHVTVAARNLLTVCSHQLQEVDRLIVGKISASLALDRITEVQELEGSRTRGVHIKRYNVFLIGAQRSHLGVLIFAHRNVPTDRIVLNHLIVEIADRFHNGDSVLVLVLLKVALLPFRSSGKRILHVVGRRSVLVALHRLSHIGRNSDSVYYVNLSSVTERILTVKFRRSKFRRTT